MALDPQPSVRILSGERCVIFGVLRAIDLRSDPTGTYPGASFRVDDWWFMLSDGSFHANAQDRPPWVRTIDGNGDDCRVHPDDLETVQQMAAALKARS